MAIIEVKGHLHGCHKTSRNNVLVHEVHKSR